MAQWMSEAKKDLMNYHQPLQKIFMNHVQAQDLRKLFEDMCAKDAADDVDGVNPLLVTAFKKATNPSWAMRDVMITQPLKEALSWEFHQEFQCEPPK